MGCKTSWLLMATRSSQAPLLDVAPLANSMTEVCWQDQQVRVCLFGSTEAFWQLVNQRLMLGIVSRTFGRVDVFPLGNLPASRQPDQRRTQPKSLAAR